MSDQKIQPTEDSVEAFLAGVADERKRSDSEKLIEMMTSATGKPPVMWGTSIVGFGSYHYRYESGREGDWIEVGFSPRSKALSLYLSNDLAGHQDLLDKLGKHKVGVGCLYVTRLANVDEQVLDELIRASVADVRETWK